MGQYRGGGGQGRQQQAGRSQGRQGQSSSPLMTADEAKQIVADGDMDLLISKAKGMANALGGGDQSQTQLRRLFGEVRRIDMAWTDERADTANNRLLMLKPRLRYQAARGQLRREFVDAIEQAIDQVQKDRARFKHFADLAEAVLAYAKK